MMETVVLLDSAQINVQVMASFDFQATRGRLRVTLIVS